MIDTHRPMAAAFRSLDSHLVNTNHMRCEPGLPLLRSESSRAIAGAIAQHEGRFSW